MTALGFMQMQFTWYQNGKRCGTSFSMGFDDGVDTGDPLVVESAMRKVQGAWDESEDALFNVSRLGALLPDKIWVGNISAKLVGRGGIGGQPMQLPLNVPGETSRTPTQQAELLPVSQTLSFYAPRELFLGRGAKVALSGGFEGDWGGDGVGWLTGAGTFYQLGKQFVQGFQSFVSTVATGFDTPIVPAVVVRVPDVSASGKPTSRLPLKPSDSAVTWKISQFEPSVQAGSQNKRKRKLR